MDKQSNNNDKLPISTTAYAEDEFTSFNATNITTAPKAPSVDIYFWITIVYIVIGLFGLIGNVFVFFVIIRSKKMREKVINKLILYQSCLDGLAALLILITCNIRYNVVRPDDSLKEQILCILWTSKLVMWALFLASTFNLVVITLERYFAMVYTLMHKRITPSRIYTMMAIPTVIAFVFQTAQISTTSGVSVEKKCHLLYFFPSTNVARFYIIFSASFQFYIPLLIMISAYGHIFVELYKQSHKHFRTSGRHDFEEQRSNRLRRASVNVLKTLILVCVLFFLCWAGNTSSFVLFVFGVTPGFISTKWYHISTCLCFLNCAVNPFVYSIQYKEFKMATRQLLTSIINTDATELTTSSTSKSNTNNTPDTSINSPANIGTPEKN